jgi:hypothetical protein
LLAGREISFLKGKINLKERCGTKISEKENRVARKM